MDAPLYSLPSQRRAPLFWRFHCIYMHTYIRLVGLTVSHRPHFSMFLFSGSTVAWYIPWSVKWNSVLIQLNWGLVHSIYYVPNVVAPAIVMHWQLPHTCQSSLCCLLLVHNALLSVCFSGMGFLHSTPNHLLLQPCSGICTCTAPHHFRAATCTILVYIIFVSNPERMTHGGLTA